ncbi:MAG: response regulator [Tepidibacter sp.]|jgi:two-component system response regulator YcbB|uniref:response regulator n=1 Tax=Tepidibacter sp. TaxID=2529387 RepID=UPI0025DB06E3|nr:response regulator [Tepidibacter sp.]MCT4508314.1 response regulator [Tepidibacter sp.]
MKFYIVDDDISVVKVLENIIEYKNLGEVIGYSLSGEECIKEILVKNPDIVIVDLLMPCKNGIEVVKNVKNIKRDIRFIMISQVSSKDMIAKAYNKGIEFFINKPINIIEVEKVINNVKEKIEMNATLNSIKGMFKNLESDNKSASKKSEIAKIKYSLSKLGIIGEIGSKDIINICEYIITKGDKYLNYKVSEMCKKLSNNPKAMEQRIRRAINKALNNIASLGIEDYMNNDFSTYSNLVFNFEDVKTQMDYIRGKSSVCGKISVKKFIEGLIIQNEIM